MFAKYARTAVSALCLAVGFAAFANPVLAQQRAPVELKSTDGSVTIKGNLISFENGFYTIEVPSMGRLRVEAVGIECTGLVCPVIENFGPEISIHGSRTVGTTLIPNLLRGYARSIGARFEIQSTEDRAVRIVRLFNADGTLRAEIDLQTRGSGSAFKSLGEEAAHLGLADRRLKDSDLNKLAVSGIGDLRDTADEHVLGLDGIVLVTHPDNPVRDISSAEVARIFSGEITNWQELGGGDVPISLNSFNEGSGDRSIVIDRLVTPQGRVEKSDVTRWKSYQDMLDAVMDDRGGLGYSGRWLARTNDVNILAIRESCGLLSPPTDFRMKIEGYSLSRRLYAYTPPQRLHPEIRDFLAWVKSDEAQPFIKDSHFIDRDLERMKLADMGMMLIHTAAVEPDFNGPQYSEMMRQLRSADRLSTSFRFNPGSSVLDVESVRNVQDLANRLQSGEFEGLEVLLVGFADSIGDRVQNTRLAQSRANTVSDLLGRALPPAAASKANLRALSFGELLPLSCNTDDVGRARNRRVEVWLRLPQTNALN